MDLFDFKNNENSETYQPLSERLRPKTLSDFMTPEDSDSSLQRVLKIIDKTGRIPNMILWGPPGTGKTTLARIIATQTKSRFIQVNAVDTGAKKLRDLGSEAREERRVNAISTGIFIDEIHRLNKAQQDVLLPFSESGDFSLIGATTENPGYELNSALLSRVIVVPLARHSKRSLKEILDRALKYFKLTEGKFFEEDAEDLLLASADGDARKLLNMLESLMDSTSGEQTRSILSREDIVGVLGADVLAYDKSSDQHYDTISAFIKSIRGSDPDAAVYYLARMLQGGEDPKFIARRLVISASEDIGNADPRALQVAISGFEAVEKVGLPEAAINLAQVTTYLASCPKSNRAYLALKNAQARVRETGHLPIPKALRSAQTKFAKSQGFGEGYKYSHDGERGYQEQDFLPGEIKNEKFYEPTDHGFEKNITQYLAWLRGK